MTHVIGAHVGVICENVGMDRLCDCEMCLAVAVYVHSVVLTSKVYVFCLV